MPAPSHLSSAQKVKYAFSSPSNFYKAIELESSSRLANEDLLPSPPARWTWSVWSFGMYWWSESWNISTWSVGSSMVALGMTVRDAILLQFFANLLSSAIIVANGRFASRYHVGFPVIARAVFGQYGHYFFVLIRSILGIIWGGVQLYFEGQFISIMLRCIFTGWAKVPNGIPASQGITTQVFVGFFLAFLLTIPFMFIHTSRIRHLFTVKSFVLPIAGLGLVIWATKSNGGVGASALEVPRTTSTTVFAFAVLSQFNSVMGSNSALLVTVPDLARYSKKPSDQIWGQLISLPIAMTLCSAFGIIVTAAVQNMWGTAYWNPYDLLNGILDKNYGSAARAGVFFVALAFGFATLGTSIACNIIPFAADVTCMLPKFVNIIRGQFICLIVAFAITPWHILTSAPTFLNFLGGYAIFQGNVVSIMVVDYFIIRKGNMDMAALYSESHSATYFYTAGINFRALAAFLIGFLLPLPGFIGSFGTTTVSVAASRLFTLGWLLSFLVGGVSYWILCLIFPPVGSKNTGAFESGVAEALEWEGEESAVDIPHGSISSDEDKKQKIEV